MASLRMICPSCLKGNHTVEMERDFLREFFVCPACNYHISDETFYLKYSRKDPQ